MDNFIELFLNLFYFEYFQNKVKKKKNKMTSNTFQMVNFSVDDLTELISNCVKAELQKISNVIQLNPKVENNELLSRKQASELLGVSYTTLFHWNNDKTLPAKKIGNKVFYQKSAIMDKINNVA